ncbi:hypothetical protein [Qipengyuania sp.]|uniref:hypothetical protein n=1 Tax=Qipengyuania sp. TaxID=2004515 RepID=UPI003735CBDF
MNKLLLGAVMTGTLMLGGCATYGGGLFGGYDDDRYGDRYGDNYGYSGGQDFERAAANACGREASRYGRATISRVVQENRDEVVVTGRIRTNNDRNDEFGCTFNRDGRIVDFRRF